MEGWIWLAVVSTCVLAGCSAPATPAGGEAPESEGGKERLPEVRGEGRAPSDDAAAGSAVRPYLEVRQPTGAAPSPDGQRVCWIDRVTGVPQVWRMDAPLGWPRQVTRFADRATSVRWTPDGERLLVTGDVGGDERDDLLLVKPDGSDPRTLARGADGRHGAGGFTPDGRTLVYVSTRRHAAFFDLWAVDTATGESRMLLQDDAMHEARDVSPDGRFVLDRITHSNSHQELAVVDLATGERRRLLPDAPAAVLTDPEWAPDGRSVYVLSDLGRDFRALLRVPVDGGPPQVVYAPEGDVDAIAISTRTTLIAVAVNDRGWSRLELIDPSGAAAPRVVLRGGRLTSGLVFASKAPVLFFGWGEGVLPGAIHRLDVAAANAVPEVVVPPDLGGLDASTFVTPVEWRFPSFDGVEISGFLYRPRDAGTVRSCVVMVHGGPEAQYRPGFDSMAQMLVARGHAVFAPNVRGSSGYGRKFQSLDDGRLRMDSVADLAAIHDKLVQEGVADRDRIAVYGGSYGGFMVLAALTHQPERWAAGVDVVGIAHLGTFLRNTGAYRARHRAQEYGDPVTDADFHEATAPLNHAHRIVAPLLVLHGRNDPRVPLSEAEQIVAAAKANGAAVELRIYDDEGHGFAKFNNRLDATTKSVEFLDGVLKKR
jgi:dipeptidyl aminopeptidase/acylaminoacyl peptidase